MTKTNEQTARVAKTAKVLTAKDFPKIAGGSSDKELAAEYDKELRKLSAATGAPRAKAQLARGISAGDAKQSAKAVADQNRSAKATNKADAATQKPVTADAKAAKLAASDARKITFVAPNPKRPGSASFDRFANYKKGMTVAQAIAAGVTRGDIDWDSKRDFIKFA